MGDPGDTAAMMYAAPGFLAAARLGYSTHRRP